MNSANDDVPPSILDAVIELAALIRRALREVDDVALQRRETDSIVSSRLYGME